MLAKLSDNLGILTPWHTVNELQKGFWGLLDDLGESVIHYRTNFPRVSMEETDKDYVIQFALSGYKSDDVDVSVVGNFLTVKADREKEDLESGEKYLHREREVGRYEETIKLPGRVKAAEVSAKYTDGVLSVTLPKREAEKPFTIKVNE